MKYMNYTQYCNYILSNLKGYTENTPHDEESKQEYQLFLKILDNLEEEELKLVYLKYVHLASYAQGAGERRLFRPGNGDLVCKHMGLTRYAYRKIKFHTLRKLAEMHKEMKEGEH